MLKSNDFNKKKLFMLSKKEFRKEEMQRKDGDLKVVLYSCCHNHHPTKTLTLRVRQQACRHPVAAVAALLLAPVEARSPVEIRLVTRQTTCAEGNKKSDFNVL